MTKNKEKFYEKFVYENKGGRCWASEGDDPDQIWQWIEEYGDERFDQAIEMISQAKNLRNKSKC